MIAFLLALLLWMLGHGPAPTPHGLMVAPAASAPAVVPPAHRAPRSETRRPAAPPTVAAAPSIPPPPAYGTTDVDPQDGRMCLDPVDCPPGR